MHNQSIRARACWCVLVFTWVFIRCVFVLCVCVSEELLNRGGCEVCVCAEVDEMRSQVSRLQSRNRELELQSSGRNSDHARQIRQVRGTHCKKVNSYQVYLSNL